MKLDGNTTYKLNFSKSGEDQGGLDQSELELRRLHREKMRKGTLNMSSQKVPFRGNSTTNDTFKDTSSVYGRVQRCKPIDEVLIISYIYSCLFQGNFIWLEIQFKRQNMEIKVW